MYCAGAYWIPRFVEIDILRCDVMSCERGAVPQSVCVVLQYGPRRAGRGVCVGVARAALRRAAAQAGSDL
eukprot:5629781-Prymnesium_polylepis.2